jgi:hypothetical protein
MRENKFKPIKELFIDYLKEECRKINTEFNYAKCNVETHFPPNDEPRYGSFSMYISCLLDKSEFEGSDNVALGILAYDWDNKFTINADICWGHPSGKLEAEVFAEPAPVNKKSLATIKDKLPDLVSKLRDVIRDNPPK